MIHFFLKMSKTCFIRKIVKYKTEYILNKYFIFHIFFLHIYTCIVIFHLRKLIFIDIYWTFMENKQWMWVQLGEE